MKAEKPVLGHFFPYISGPIGPIVSENSRVRSWVNRHKPCEFYVNRFKIATCIVRFSREI